LFAVKNHTWELIKTAAYNTFELLAIPIFTEGLILPPNVQKSIIKRFYPEDINTIKRSLQYWNHMDRIFPQYWYYFCYVAAIVVCLIGFLYFLIMRRDCLSDPVFQFCCFAILAMVFNAGLMANASGIFGRYQIRVLAIPFITTFSLVGLIPLKYKTYRAS
jgi:hypothetical protein